MPLTPEDVHNKQFTTVRLREGYDEEEVDAFLDEVEAELTRLIRENEELRAKLAAATRAAASAAAAPVPMRREPTPIPPPAPPVQAQLPAPLPAPLPVPQAPQFQAPGGDSAARVLALAQQTADQAIAEARNEANKIVGEARGRADGMEREARGKADALERDAQEKHRVAMGSLETARAALERKVDDLRAFEREYRQRLKSYLDGQMRQLEASGGDDLASSMGGRSQLSPTGLSAPPPAPSGPPMPMQASLPPGMPSAPAPVGAGMNGGGMGSTGSYQTGSTGSYQGGSTGSYQGGSTGSFQSANNGTNAAALTQTMAPIRPQMPPPPMGGGQQPPFMGSGNGLGQPPVPSQPSPMRGFLIDEDPDA
jgi:DivIVA domain-containing protein